MYVFSHMHVLNLYVIWLCCAQYVVVAPWAIHSTYSFIVNDGEDRDLSYFLVLPFILWRMLHNQIWISLSRYRTSKGSGRIVDKGLEFEQVDRERNWSVVVQLGFAERSI